MYVCLVLVWLYLGGACSCWLWDGVLCAQVRLILYTYAPAVDPGASLTPAMWGPDRDWISARETVEAAEFRVVKSGESLDDKRCYRITFTMEGVAKSAKDGFLVTWFSQKWRVYGELVVGENRFDWGDGERGVRCVVQDALRVGALRTWGVWLR